MAEIHEGGCLCGAVRYRVTGDDPKFTAVCHCKFCQKRTGSAFAEAVYFDETAVQIVGALKTYEYRTDESGRWIKSEFCPNCGTSVTWTIEAFPGWRAIAQGTLDDPNWIKHQLHAWTRSAQAWMVFPPDMQLCETQLGLDEFK